MLTSEGFAPNYGRPIGEARVQPNPPSRSWFARLLAAIESRIDYLPAKNPWHRVRMVDLTRFHSWKIRWR